MDSWFRECFWWQDNRQGIVVSFARSKPMWFFSLVGLITIFALKTIRKWYSGCSVFSVTSRTLICNEHFVCKIWCVSLNQKKPFPAPCLNMVGENLILTAKCWIKTYHCFFFIFNMLSKSILLAAVHWNKLFGAWLTTAYNSNNQGAACWNAKCLWIAHWFRPNKLRNFQLYSLLTDTNMTQCDHRCFFICVRLLLMLNVHTST